MQRYVIQDGRGKLLDVQESGARDGFTMKDGTGALIDFPAWDPSQDPALIRADEAYAKAEEAGRSVMSSGAIADVTPEQQESIGEGTLVTTTDGRRWRYKGAGSKTDEASYVEMADVTPEYAAIAGRPPALIPVGFGDPLWVPVSDTIDTEGETIPDSITFDPPNYRAGRVQRGTFVIAPGSTGGFPRRKTLWRYLDGPPNEEASYAIVGYLDSAPSEDILTQRTAVIYDNMYAAMSNAGAITFSIPVANAAQLRNGGSSIVTVDSVVPPNSAGQLERWVKELNVLAVAAGLSYDTFKSEAAVGLRVTSGLISLDVNAYPDDAGVLEPYTGAPVNSSYSWRIYHNVGNVLANENGLSMPLEVKLEKYDAYAAQIAGVDTKADEVKADVDELGQYSEVVPAVLAKVTGTVPVVSNNVLSFLGFSDGGQIAFRAGFANSPFDGSAQDYIFAISNAAVQTVGDMIDAINALPAGDPSTAITVSIEGGFLQVEAASPFVLAYADSPFSPLTQFGMPGFPTFGEAAPGYDFTTEAEHVEATQLFPNPRPYPLPAAGPRATVDEQLSLLKQTQDINRGMFVGVRMASTFGGDGVFAMRFPGVTFSAGQTYPFISCFVGATRITSIEQDGPDMVVNGVNYDPVTGDPIPVNSVFGFLFIGQLFDDGSFG